jgi:hypothetical protein
MVGMIVGEWGRRWKKKREEICGRFACSSVFWAAASRRLARH